MATYEIISWRGVPTLVEARDEGGTVTRPLSARFQALVDAMAMELGLAGSEAYLEHWSRSAPLEKPGPAGTIADAVVTDLERRFDEFSGWAARRS